MPTQEDLDAQEQLLQAYRQTLSHYLLQQAMLGTAYLPPSVANGILETRAHIRSIKQTLQNWGRPVTAHPNDEEVPTAINNSIASSFQWQDTHLLQQIWNHLEPDLQDALTLAFTQACRDGSNRIQTRLFFAAIARLHPEPLHELLNLLPPSALPKPINDQIILSADEVAGPPQLSACVADSLSHLGPKATSEQKLSSADVFVDIAKYGTGKSVARLRQYGVTPETIDTAVDQLGWQLVTR